MQFKSYPKLFRTQKITLVGCGQVGYNLIYQFKGHHFTATYHSIQKHNENQQRLNAKHVQFIQIDLKEIASIHRLRAFTRRMIWLAPPVNNDHKDNMLRHLLLRPITYSNLYIGQNKPRIVYVSTTGVYGDLQGNWADEKTPVKPESERAQRRVDVEQSLRNAYTKGFVTSCVIRAPGIYSEKRLPLTRLINKTPALQPEQDAYSNHIHETDLARICFLALFKARPWDIVNAVDENPMKMGDYFDLIAQHYGLAPPPRMAKQELQHHVSPMMWSFMRESRKIQSTRLKQLNIPLRYPTVSAFLSTLKNNKL